MIAINTTTSPILPVNHLKRAALSLLPLIPFLNELETIRTPFPFLRMIRSLCL